MCFKYNTHIESESDYSKGKQTQTTFFNDLQTREKSQGLKESIKSSPRSESSKTLKEVRDNEEEEEMEEEEEEDEEEVVEEKPFLFF